MRVQGFLEYAKTKYILTAIAVLCAVFLIYHLTHAATITQYSDRLSTSAPNLSANHTINFTTDVSIPAGGYIRFTPEPGEFTIPAVDFDIDNVALFVSTGAGYTQRLGTSTAPSATEDGISIMTGTSGNIEITLNSTDAIPAGAEIRILIGSHTPNATTTDVGITNPATTGTHNYYLATGGTVDSEVRGHYAILEQVGVGPVDTRETDPPVRFNGAPMGVLSGTSIIIQMSLETDEFARCRYSTASGTPYSSMGNEFSTTFVVIHTEDIAVATSTSYSFFVRCIDDEGNVNLDDYEISFSIPEYPEGNPGDTGDEEGNGEGEGGGSGSGDTGSGSGSSGGDSSGSGGSGGGSGGGGGGGSGGSSGGDGGSGGFEGSDRPYQSGEGRVIITGYAFPRSTIVALVDGAIAENAQSTATGEFSITIDEIARGAYTFGVYGIDRNGVRSSTFSTTFTVTGARGSTLSNINVMPSISVSPNPVDPNSTLAVSGYTIPNATVTIENQNDRTSASLKTFTATSDANGAWSVSVSTDGFSTGTYKVRAKAKQDSGVSTNFSGYTFYGVGQAAAVPRSSDLNRDGKVNLTDFSILLFWWNTDGGASNPPADINQDGRVSLTDFSILIFNWTG